jgi:hypothetical protein
MNIKERRARGRGGSPRPDHPIASTIQAWFGSQSNFITFMYPSDGSPFGSSLGTDSLYVDWLNAESLPLVGDHVFHMISHYSCQHSHFWYLQVCHQKPSPIDRTSRYWHLKKQLSRSRRFGESLEPWDIFGAMELDQWAITLSSKDGCFQAHLLVIIARSLPFPLSDCLGTLAYDLGCFPLDFGS